MTSPSQSPLLREVVDALKGVEWRSTHKDNMEFAATITYSQMNKLKALLPRLEAALAEGVVLVPEEPTEGMALAGLGALKEQLGDTSVIVRDPVFCWRAMVHASQLTAPIGEPDANPNDESRRARRMERTP